MLLNGKIVLNGKFCAGNGIYEKKSRQHLLASKARLCNVEARSSALNGSDLNGRIIFPQIINVSRRHFFYSYNH